MDWGRFMRIFTAGVITETNTFSPSPTGLRGFEEGGLYRGDCSTADHTELGAITRLFHALAAQHGDTVTEGLYTIAQPAGPTLQAVWEGFRDEITEQARTDGPFDLILLCLHGAMVATACDDCEGDLVHRLRQDHAGARIGVVLDPHCHLTQALIDDADAVILMKEYPHIDLLDRARELYALCRDAAAGRTVPTSALFDCRMVGFYPTTVEPMAGLLRAMREMEARPGVSSVSFAHGFPWGDTADTGAKVLVITDNDAPLAVAAAAELGRAIYRQRRALLPVMPGIAEALTLADHTLGRVVMADTADNPGGGAPGDNVSLLRAMLAHGVHAAVFGAVWDPMAAIACEEAGVGARFALRLGGKSGVASGDPLDVMVTVRAIRRDHDQMGLDGVRMAMGLSVWIDCEDIAVVICSLRTQVYAPDAYTGLGITLDDKRLVAVKSSQHFQAAFAPLADRIISVATPGALQMNFAQMDYKKRRDLNFFPLVDDPHGMDAE
jgi:microcystin degradation protein MlrC